MDNLRPILFITIAILMLWLWNEWQEQQAPQPVATTSQTIDGSPAPSAQMMNTPSAGPDAAMNPPQPAAGGENPPMIASRGRVTESFGTVSVETDVLSLRFDRNHADLVGAQLRTYSVSSDKPDQPFVLMNDELPNVFLAKMRVAGLDGSATLPPQALFTTESDRFELRDTEDHLSVPFRWQGEDGLVVERIYHLSRGSFKIDVETRVTNNTGDSWSGHVYRQLQRTQIAEASNSAFIHTYMGGVVYSPEEKYERISFDDMKDENFTRQVQDGWVAMIQHYFMVAWVPEQNTEQHFYTRTLNQAQYVVGMSSPRSTLPPGDTKKYQSTLWVGPKLQNELEAVATGLELTSDYGVFTVIAKPLFWLLDKIHGVVGNWGWAIIFLTLLIKLAFYKLSEASYKSMANMRRIAPRLKSLKERYGDDKARFQKEMMGIYQKEKINPLGGCLPILVQIPVFISLYWVLLESVELRQAPWMFWIQDLSIRDPYYILPVIMGISMIIQHKLNPQPPDPMQAKIMMALPVVFSVFFAFFPSGLVLYWVVNNVLSITQQWYITRKIEAAYAKKN